MKKISPNLIGFIIGIIIVVFTIYYYTNYAAKKSDHIIDNNSSDAVKVQIDDIQYSLAPQQSLPIHLNTGSHNLKVLNSDNSILKESNFTVKDIRGVINLWEKPYFIFSLPYGPKVNADSIYRNNKTTYLGKTYHGELSIDSSGYIENFYYNLNEDFPAITKKSLNDTLRSKIFREDDFKQFYFEKFE